MKRISKAQVLLVMLIAIMALLGCKKLKEMTGGGDESKSGDKSSGSAAASGDSIGVPECDEFITKYEKCITDSVPAAAQESLKQSMKQMRDGYKQAASTEAGKKALAQSCKQSLETTKQAMAAYKCSW